MKLVIATRNAGKLREIRDIFDFTGLEVSSAFDYPEIPDVVEDGDTFEANAVKKAVEIAQATGCWALADDSGLEVDALDGAPGVYSARYAGEPCSNKANNEKLLRELAGQDSRTARFRCVIALSNPEGHARTVDGDCRGSIAEQERGNHGFGYDPLFVPEGFSETFAELSPEEKHSISHRGRALQKAHDAWADLLRP
jgi:XTP/dITP diphosphohydrolase